MFLQYPFPEPWFIFVERKIPVKGFPENGLTAAYRGMRIDKVGRA